VIIPGSGNLHHQGITKRLPFRPSARISAFPFLKWQPQEPQSERGSRKDRKSLTQSSKNFGAACAVPVMPLAFGKVPPMTDATRSLSVFAF